MKVHVQGIWTKKTRICVKKTLNQENLSQLTQLTQVDFIPFSADT